MGFQRMQKAGGIVALGHDPHIVFQHQHTGRTRSEDRLVVGKDNSIHREMPPPARMAPPLLSSATLA